MSRPLRRHGYISSTEVSSSTYCPSGYLTTARFIQGPTGYYWNRIQSDITLTDEWRYYPYEADNFDNYNTYQFVSAETTYQSETIKSAISSIGETNLSLNGLKFVFGQNMSAPLYYAKRTELAESKHYYPYQAAAGVIEMGRGNSFLHLPQSYYNEIDGVVGDEVNPDKLLTFCATSYWERESRVIEKSASFLGLDVICDWNGGEFRTSRIPFWWGGVSVIGEEIASWSRVMTNGYARYNIESDVTVIPDETQSVYQSYATKTQYVSM